MPINKGHLHLVLLLLSLTSAVTAHSSGSGSGDDEDDESLLLVLTIIFGVALAGTLVLVCVICVCFCRLVRDRNKAIGRRCVHTSCSIVTENLLIHYVIYVALLRSRTKSKYTYSLAICCECSMRILTGAHIYVLLYLLLLQWSVQDGPDDLLTPDHPITDCL